MQPSYVDPIDPNKTIIDRVHNLYEGIDTDNANVLGTLILCSSLSIDFMMLYILHSVSKHKRYYLYFAMMLFYLVRFVIQQLTTLPLPNNYKFHNYFNVPSLFVRYQVFGDLYPSGHVSVPLFFLQSTDNYLLKRFAVFQLFYQSFIVTYTRSHYFIDIVGGVSLALNIIFVSKWLYSKLQTLYYSLIISILVLHA